MSSSSPPRPRRLDPPTEPAGVAGLPTTATAAAPVRKRKRGTTFRPQKQQMKQQQQQQQTPKRSTTAPSSGAAASAIASTRATEESEEGATGTVNRSFGDASASTTTTATGNAAAAGQAADASSTCQGSKDTSDRTTTALDLREETEEEDMDRHAAVHNPAVNLREDGGTDKDSGGSGASAAPLLSSHSPAIGGQAPIVRAAAAAAGTATPRPRPKKKATTSVRIGAAATATALATSGATAEPLPTTDTPTTDVSGVPAPAATTARSHRTTLKPALEAGAAPATVAAGSGSAAPALSHYCSSFRAKRAKSAIPNAPNPLRSVIPAPALPPPPQDGGAAAAAAGPIVQIVNGEIVLQASSVVVTGGTTAAALGGATHPLHGDVDPNGGGVDVIEEEEHPSVIGASYTSFTNRSRTPQHWKADETKRFYDALRQVGTDFHAMAAYFADRTRKQLKRKYQRELIQNPVLIERALHPDAKRGIDLTVFQVTQSDIEAVQKEAEERERLETGAEAAAAAAATAAGSTANETPDGALEDDDTHALDAATAEHDEATDRATVRRREVANRAASDVGDDDAPADNRALDPLLLEPEDATDPLLEPEEGSAMAAAAGPGTGGPAIVALLPGVSASAAGKAKVRRPKFRSTRRKRTA